MNKEASVKMSKNGKEESTNSHDHNNSVSVFALYRYATWFDLLVLLVGTIGAMANGTSLSLYAILLGSIFNELNSPAGLSENSIYELVGIGCAVILAGGMQV